MTSYVINYILWVLSCITGCVIMCYAFELKRDTMKIWKVILGLFFAQLPIMTLKFFFNYNDLIRNLAFFIMTVLYIGYYIALFAGYLWQKILYVIMEAFWACIAEMITQVLLEDAMMEAESLKLDQPITSIYLIYTYILFSLLLGSFTLVWRKWVSGKGYNLKIFLIFAIFPISQIIMLCNINLKIYREMTPGGMWTVISILIGITADVLLLGMLLRQQRMQEMSIQLKEIEKAWEIEQNHYRDIEMRREELAKIRHDMSEQFIVIQQLIHQGNNEKAEEMLNTLIEYVASTKEYIYCADSVVNAIMSENERVCRQNNIRFMHHLEIMQPLKINPVVICSIFSNLMRNAISATKEVERDSFVEIKAAVKGDYIHIRVENSFSDEYAKNKKKRKGYGLEILRTLADKYHGQMETEIKGDKYIVKIFVENIEVNEMSLSL